MRATKVARSALNNHTKNMEKALHDGVTCTFELQYLVDEFERMAMSLEKAHNSYLGILDDSELDEAIEEIDTFLLNRKKIKFKVMSKLQPQNVRVSADAVSQEEDVKLSRIELLHFDGDILNWKPFKESFIIHIHSKAKIPATTKMTRLIGLLDGEAADMVRGLSLTAESYNDAWELLEARYGCEEQINIRHVSALLNVKAPAQHKGMLYVKELYQMFNTINVHVRSLANNGIEGELLGTILCPLIVSKFPEDLALEWSRTCKGKLRDIKHTLNFLLEEIQRQERAHDLRHTMTSGMTVSTVGSSKSQSNSTNISRGTATALLTSTDNYLSSENKCDICDQLGHITENCLTFKTANVSERRRLLRAEHLCFKCLKPHMSYRCNEHCSDCGGYNHHHMICPSLEPQLQSVTDASLPKVQQGGEQTTSFSSTPLKYLVDLLVAEPKSFIQLKSVITLQYFRPSR